MMADHFVGVNKMVSYRGFLGNCPGFLDSSRQLIEIFDQFANCLTNRAASAKRKEPPGVETLTAQRQTVVRPS
jgi:hypothetical protein